MRMFGVRSTVTSTPPGQGGFCLGFSGRKTATQPCHPTSALDPLARWPEFLSVRHRTKKNNASVVVPLQQRQALGGEKPLRAISVPTWRQPDHEKKKIHGGTFGNRKISEFTTQPRQGERGSVPCLGRSSIAPRLTSFDLVESGIDNAICRKGNNQTYCTWYRSFFVPRRSRMASQETCMGCEDGRRDDAFCRLIGRLQVAMSPCLVARKDGSGRWNAFESRAMLAALRSFRSPCGPAVQIGSVQYPRRLQILPMHTHATAPRLQCTVSRRAV